MYVFTTDEEFTKNSFICFDQKVLKRWGWSGGAMVLGKHSLGMQQTNIVVFYVTRCSFLQRLQSARGCMGVVGWCDGAG